MNRYLRCGILLCTGLLLGCSAHSIPSRDRDYLAGRQLYQQQDYHAAYLRLLTAAQHGHPGAQYAVGYQLYRGMGVTQNQTLALYWLQRAAKQGDARAQRALAHLDAQRDALLNSVNPPKR